MRDQLKFTLAENSEIYSMGGEGYLYNHAVYLRHKENTFGRPLTFYALQGQKAVAKIHFFLVKQNHRGIEAISIPASPFGSFEYEGVLSTQALTDFVSYIKHKLLTSFADSIVIRDCIPVYREEGHYDLQEILLKAGFHLTEEWINHHIIVDHQSLYQKMHTMEKRRLKKCIAAGFVFDQEPLSSLKRVYDFIHACRAEKGWYLSMGWDEIKQVTSLFPDHYLLFTMKDKDEIVAATLAVRVNRRVLYNFYPASRVSYHSFSPIVMLTSGLYQFCQQTEIRLLDLGTSSTLSLQQFKQHLGGVASYKSTYQYSV